MNQIGKNSKFLLATHYLTPFVNSGTAVEDVILFQQFKEW